MLEFVLPVLEFPYVFSFVFWYYQIYKNGKYFIYPKYMGHIWDMLRSKEWWSLNGSPKYYMILQLELFCKRAGKGYEILQVDTFMLFHQEEKKSEGCPLMVSQSERKPKGEPVLQEERGNENGDILFRNLKPPPVYPAFPLAEQAALAVYPTAPRHATNIFTPFTTSCFPYPWKSSRSFYVHPQSTGPWLSITI